MEDIETLKKLTGEEDIDLLDILLKDAQERVLGYTGRTKMIDSLRKPARDLAVIAYNLRGTEGEESRSAAGENSKFNDLPKSVVSVLNRYRLARIGGKTYEAKSDKG